MSCINLYICAVLLIGFITNINCSEKLTTDDFQRALLISPYDKIHQSDCLIKACDKDNVCSTSSGTYMFDEHTQKTFVITASHIYEPEKKKKLTASFDAITDYPLVGLTPVIDDLYAPENKDIILIHQTLCGNDILIGFIPDYKGDIQPARFKPFVIPQEDKKSLSDYLCRKKQAFIMKNEICSLAGYGKLIQSLGRSDGLWATNNINHIKTLMTLKASYSYDFYSLFTRGYRLESIYQKPGTNDATSYEQPLRQGFSGATLRDKEGYVVAVASYGDDTPLKNSFREKHPRVAQMIQTTHEFIKDNHRATFTVPILAIGLILSYAIKNERLKGRGLRLTMIASCFASFLPDIEYPLWTRLRFPGTKSYFSGTSIWENRISTIVAHHYEELEKNNRNKA